MDVIIDNLPTYLSGFGTTILLLVVSGLAALVIGTIVAAMRISPVATLRPWRRSTRRSCATPR